jgi:short subunit dehydrogenase-like uncharacterized protein
MIPSAAFDSLPSDLGSFLAVQSLLSFAPQAKVSKVRSLFTVAGAVSAGTFESIEELVKNRNRIPINEITLSKEAGYKLSSSEFSCPFIMSRRLMTFCSIWKDTEVYFGRKI